MTQSGRKEGEEGGDGGHRDGNGLSVRRMGESAMCVGINLRERERERETHRCNMESADWGTDGTAQVGKGRKGTSKLGHQITWNDTKEWTDLARAKMENRPKKQ